MIGNKSAEPSCSSSSKVRGQEASLSKVKDTKVSQEKPKLVFINRENSAFTKHKHEAIETDMERKESKCDSSSGKTGNSLKKKKKRIVISSDSDSDDLDFGNGEGSSSTKGEGHSSAKKLKLSKGKYTKGDNSLGHKNDTVHRIESETNLSVLNKLAVTRESSTSSNNQVVIDSDSEEEFVT